MSIAGGTTDESDGGCRLPSSAASCRQAIGNIILGSGALLFMRRSRCRTHRSTTTIVSITRELSSSTPPRGVRHPLPSTSLSPLIRLRRRLRARWRNGRLFSARDRSYSMTPISADRQSWLKMAISISDGGGALLNPWPLFFINFVTPCEPSG